VFPIKLALMRVACATVVTQHFASPANAVESLVDYDAITCVEILDVSPYFFDRACDLVPENLWLQNKWYWQTKIVEIVVGVTGVDVRVSATDSDSCDANKHFVRSNDRTWNIADFKLRHGAKHTSPHHRPGG
jgi:hypothetical protein